MRIGIVGTGWVAGLHLDALKAIDDAEVVAIAGRNGERAATLAAPFRATTYVDPIDMLRRERLDVAFVLLPPHLHGEVERACAEHVRGVLIEKPIANTLDVALRVADDFERAGTIVSVGYMNRYRRGVATARAYFARPENVPVLARGWWVTPMPPPRWWRTFAESGGQFTEQCTHLVDLCRHLMGEIVEVSAFAARGFVRDVPGYSVDDAMVVNARFASGALATFSTGCFPTKDVDGGVGLSVAAASGRVDFAGWGMAATLHAGDATPQVIDSEPDVFVTQARALLTAVATGDVTPIRSSYRDGLGTLAATIAATASARDHGGRPVRVDA